MARAALVQAERSPQLLLHQRQRTPEQTCPISIHLELPPRSNREAAKPFKVILCAPTVIHRVAAAAVVIIRREILIFRLLVNFPAMRRDNQVKTSARETLIGVSRWLACRDARVWI